MKANQTAKNNKMDDKAEVGIGTMIVFIAAVIVAAVAAAVLINTAGNLQRKASETGEETTQEVAANMFVRDIVGQVHATDTDKVDELYFYISLAPGAEPIDLNSTVLRWKHSGNLTNLEVSSTTNCDAATFLNLGDGFCVRTVKETASSNKNKYVLSEGDRVRIEIHLGKDGTADERVSVRSSADVLLIPEVGSPVDASFKTPPTFGDKTYLSLA